MTEGARWWSVTDGAGVVHIVTRPRRGALAYHTVCKRAFGGDEIQYGKCVPTCLECVAHDSH